MPKGDEWTPHEGGRRPRTGDRPVLVRLRCVDRQQAETWEPRLSGWWPRWTHDGGGGDIIEWKYTTGKEPK